MQTATLDKAWRCMKCDRRWCEADKADLALGGAMQPFAVAPVAQLRPGPPPAAYEVVLEGVDAIRVTLGGGGLMRPEEARRLSRILQNLAYLAEREGARVAGHDRWKFSGGAGERRASFGNPQPTNGTPRDYSHVVLALRPMCVRGHKRHDRLSLPKCDACHKPIEPGPAYGAAARLTGYEGTWPDSAVRDVRFCVACVEAKSEVVLRRVK